MSSRTTCQVGLVGYGAIGKSVADALLDGRASNASPAAVLVRDVNKYWGCLQFSSSPPRITSADVPLSVIKAIRNLASPVCLGV